MPTARTAGERGWLHRAYARGGGDVSPGNCEKASLYACMRIGILLFVNAFEDSIYMLEVVFVCAGAFYLFFAEILP
jgi:hypothetical protein